MRLRTAEEARKRVNSMADEREAALFESAAASIEKAINKGRSAVSLDVATEDHGRLSDALRSLGYKVNSGVRQMDDGWFEVSW